jgi:hypothetical protein
MDFYNYLLNCRGFKTSAISYFLVVNADKTVDGFHENMKFSETLIPYKNDTSWIPGKIKEMINVLNSSEIPDSHESCENCAYAKQRASHE